MARGASGALVVRVFGSGTALAVHVLLARLLGADGFGVYVYALTWLNLLALVALLGLDTASLRFVAEYNSRQQWGRLRGFLRRSHQIAFLASCFTAIITAGAVYALQNRLGRDTALAFWIMCLILPAFVLLLLRAAVLRAFKHIAQAQAPLEIMRPIILAGGVALIFLQGDRSPGAPAAIAVNLLATIAVLAITSWFLQHITPPAVHAHPHTYQTREWVGVAFPMLMIGGFYLVLAQTDILMLGALVETTRAGIYASASRIATLISFGLIAVNAIAAPMIAELYARKKMRELQRLVTLGSAAILAFSLPTSLVLLATGRLVLGLFGPEFTDGYSAMAILIAAQFVNALAGPVAFLMIMTGHQKEAARIVGATAALNILLNAVLIPPLGMHGAAIGTALSKASCQIAMLLYVLKHHSINPTAVPIAEHR